MAWNFLQIVEFGARSDDLYPVPNGRGIGFELSAEDSNPTTKKIIGLKVVRQTDDGPWVPSLNVLRTHGTLLISDRRIAVTFDKFVPKDRSSFRPVPFVHTDGSSTKRPKDMLVGHVLMTQLRQIGVRGPVNGKGKARGDEMLGALIVSTTDGTDGLDTRGDLVAIEIILGAGTDPVAIGNDVLSRSAIAKLSSPLLSIDQSVRQAWAEVIRHGFSPAPGEEDHHDLFPYQVVTEVRAATVPPNLIPPTDTSPVPTMLPTPAFPMPAFPVPSNRPAEVHAMGFTEPLMPTPPPPGSTAEWRPDPYGRFELRYWDGFGWTEHVHSSGQQHTDAPQ